ncbi:MAG: hypothetical protein UW01_C0002G0021 [Candidatus Nomurabacteria bacterium GW2011_GWA2_43_66]|uniref:Uncharacterized protein n=1 Tax=Candidatus Nomurabacteria bacterium GW2011_GWF2_43_24 TaxID=1618778 RepID=A0A0G1ENL8_9BACT|nr:MAG: hypothetical protein UV13_C0003G0021 [Parcubacteria group bacterium GW2011_GWC1_42_21]KKS58539.1 MAG: hypothetical protein UV23_C0005G0021 [Candidatus Nomurabacteria bacterium GW2011_GWF1_42_40]KKT00196.1 MAG: hypothetical protein UV77_C0006G0063 [Candidatus Nomurabacteria bacterium GW2011_GWA1_43_17]KKT07770.1 MAG: hypothetical protein UV85_C0005G0021 [Candidatus Nomurabacteria bacterium GW2011_GWB1_43_19]KKT11646.1 MAG: hypothetical protein UV91_C0003G0035 [Candidatus Nomurabacteria b
MIDRSPQPKDPELIAGERIYQEMLDIARKVGLSSKPTTEGNYKEFGNNFYLLF